jgi:peptide/nickel transport system permease protein
MLEFLLRRLVFSIVAFSGVVVIVFFLLQLSGDPAALLVPLEATAEDLARIRQAYGLDQPAHVQFVQYISRLARGDLGHSYRQGFPVREIILERTGATLQLAFAALFVSFALGLPLGVLAAVRRGTLLDTSAMFFAVLGMSIPSFWLALMMIILFGVLLGWLPISGYGSLKHLLMPSVVLGSVYAAQISRLARTSLLEVLAQDYVRTARAKGLREASVMVGHALRNAALPLLTVLGLDFGRLLGGAVVVESIFAWPGLGRLAVQSVLGRDFPVVQGIVMLAAAIFLATNLIVDVLYGWVDPRLRATSN